MKKQHGNTGKKNALKNPSERADILINLRISAKEKKAWKAKADKESLTLSAWIKKTLNSASK